MIVAFMECCECAMSIADDYGESKQISGKPPRSQRSASYLPTRRSNLPVKHQPATMQSAISQVIIYINVKCCMLQLYSLYFGYFSKLSPKCLKL